MVCSVSSVGRLFAATSVLAIGVLAIDVLAVDPAPLLAEDRPTVFDKHAMPN
jgi:hypothetical protein